MRDQSNAPLVVAIVGVVVGGLALLWNIAQSLRDGARLSITFYVYPETTPDHSGAVAEVQIANLGKRPAFITSVARTVRVPLLRRLPVVR